MNPKPDAFQALADSKNVADADREWTALVARNHGEMPVEASWAPWLARARKKPGRAASEAFAAAPRKAAAIDTAGKNRESGKPWAPGFPHVDITPTQIDWTVLQQVAKAAELLELIGERDLGGDQIVRLASLPVDEAIAMLEGIPVKRPRRRPLEGFSAASTTHTHTTLPEPDPFDALLEAP